MWSKFTATLGASLRTEEDYVDLKAIHCRALYKDNAKRELICAGLDMCCKKGHATLRATSQRAPPGSYQGAFSRKAGMLLGGLPGTKMSTSEYTNLQRAQRESNWTLAMVLVGLGGSKTGSRMSTPEQ